MKIILVMAATADGKIARESKEAVDWTGRADKKKFVEITKKAGVVIMGSTTFETIAKPLPKRKNIVMTRNPEKFNNIIFTADKTITSSNPLTSKELEFIEEIEFTDKTPAQIVKSLEDQGFESAALIGGSVINGLFAKENLIDEIYITVVPKLFGQGLSLFSDKIDMNLELAEAQKIDNDALLLKYNVIKN